MLLVGMLDSPFVRRVAISLKLMEIPFEHASISVFRQYDAFAAINPVVKAPTLVTEDGVVLMDSSLILEHVERLAGEGLQLRPQGLHDDARSQHLIGLALAACEKSVQLVYERELRPAEKRHAPWTDRVEGQMRRAYDLLEAGIATADPWLFGSRIMQADVSAAVAWRFTQFALPGALAAGSYPALEAFSERAEAQDAFRSTPLE